MFENEYLRYIPNTQQADHFNGTGIFYYLLYRVTGDSAYLNECVARATYSIESAEAAWFVCFLHQRDVMDIDILKRLGDFDGKIYIESLKDIIRERYSSINGGAAGVCYALNRVPDIRALGYLKQVIDILAVSKTIQLCQAHQESQAFLDAFTSFQLNNVVAVSNILARVQKSGLFTDKVTPMLEVCADFLYQTLASEPVKCGDTMLWDTGIVGQLFSVFTLSKILNSEKLREEGVKVLSGVTWPNGEEVSDVSLKSGAAGLVHVLHRLYKITHNLNCSAQRTEYMRKIIADNYLFKYPLAMEFFSGHLGVHVAFLDTLLDDDGWAEILYPIV